MAAAPAAPAASPPPVLARLPCGSLRLGSPGLLGAQASSSCFFVTLRLSTQPPHHPPSSCALIAPQASRSGPSFSMGAHRRQQQGQPMKGAEQVFVSGFTRPRTFV